MVNSLMSQSPRTSSLIGIMKSDGVSWTLCLCECELLSFIFCVQCVLIEIRALVAHAFSLLPCLVFCPDSRFAAGKLQAEASSPPGSQPTPLASFLHLNLKRFLMTKRLKRSKYCLPDAQSQNCLRGIGHPWGQLNAG